MIARTYTVADFVAAFGDNYAENLDMSERGAWIPVNALWSTAKELGLLVSEMESGTPHRDLGMHIVRLGQRLEVAAEIGATEITALQARVKELEAKLEAELDPAETAGAANG